MEGNFNPRDYLIQLRTKQGPKDYLPVAARLMWFRSEQPQGRIETELLSVSPAIVIARIYDSDDRLLATGHGYAVATGHEVWAGREIEKAETAAVGRALAHAGFGTQFTGEDEQEYLADSPQPRRAVTKSTPERDTQTLVYTARVIGVQQLPGKQRRLLVSGADDNGLAIKATAFSREPFRKAGYEVEAWATPGDYVLAPPARVTTGYRVTKAGDSYYEVMHVEQMATDQ